MAHDPQAPLKEFNPKHEFFVGIDSDGCAFDTMELKHKECFIPNIIKHWGLQSVSKYAREAAEFINLYSKWRGVNRFPALTLTFDLLRERLEVQQRQAVIPDVPTLQEFIDSGAPLSNPSLQQACTQQNDPVLDRALAWSEAVNAAIADMVEGVPPFPFVRESLEKLSSRADMIVVSATPGEALRREWQEHDIARYMEIIAGQDMGSKKEHLNLAAGARYGADHVLMIGDAPGDFKAAKANDVLFFPINPGQEEASWQRFYEEGLDRFFAGSFAGEYETNLIAEFDRLLPDTPPWK